MGGKKKNTQKKSQQTLAEKMKDAIVEKAGLDTTQAANEESKLNEGTSTIATEIS
jgi:hypothetical protein